MSRRFSDADPSAAIVYKFSESRCDICIFPPASSCVRGITVSHIDNHVDLFQHLWIFLDIFKADKTHIKRCAAKRLNNSGIAVILFLI